MRIGGGGGGVAVSVEHDGTAFFLFKLTTRYVD